MFVGLFVILLAVALSSCVASSSSEQLTLDPSALRDGSYSEVIAPTETIPARPARNASHLAAQDSIPTQPRIVEKREAAMILLIMHAAASQQNR